MLIVPSHLIDHGKSFIVYILDIVVVESIVRQKNNKFHISYAINHRN